MNFEMDWREGASCWKTRMSRSCSRPLISTAMASWYDYREFVAATYSLSRMQRNQVLLKAFRHFDLDGDGYITREELSSVLSAVPLSSPVFGGPGSPGTAHVADSVAQLVAEADQDADGRVDYREFCAMVLTAGGGDDRGALEFPDLGDGYGVGRIVHQLVQPANLPGLVDEARSRASGGGSIKRRDEPAAASDAGGGVAAADGSGIAARRALSSNSRGALSSNSRGGGGSIKRRDEPAAGSDAGGGVAAADGSGTAARRALSSNSRGALSSNSRGGGGSIKRRDEPAAAVAAASSSSRPSQPGFGLGGAAAVPQTASGLLRSLGSVHNQGKNAGSGWSTMPSSTAAVIFEGPMSGESSDGDGEGSGSEDSVLMTAAQRRPLQVYGESSVRNGPPRSGLGALPGR
ncbi:hypothetical protein Vretimale_12755 [Volvox reticuliferus]|uniref:EF-hand domain-containing protein n=1 Tax=Volvox reticuliferus TaxID=1737510 RepID=A0A8J4LSW2_9CHLO|nr:hypothetical protein Vretimale_12755 [Volvox reticuliferus]